MSNPTDLVSRPAHVPEELLVDFNHYNGDTFLQDPVVAWDEVRHRGPMAFSPHWGGFWILTDAGLMSEMFLDTDLFSSRQVMIPRFGGPVAVPVELDPPLHTAYRKFLISWGSEKSVARYTPAIEGVLAGLLAKVEGQSEFDFIESFALPLPAQVFTQILGLPEAESEAFLEWVHHLTQGHTPEERTEAVTAMRAFLRGEVESRRGSAGDDLLSIIANADIDGKPIDIQMAENTAFLVGLAGLDTTSGMVSMIWYYLATHPEFRRELTRSPESIERNMEELTRAFTTANITRIVTRDEHWHGYDLKQGDQIYLGITGANRNLGPDPILNREGPPPMNLTFGKGHHRCLGLHLVRNEIAVALRMFHERYPDYELVAEPTYGGGGLFSAKKLLLRVQ